MSQGYEVVEFGFRVVSRVESTPRAKTLNGVKLRESQGLKIGRIARKGGVRIVSSVLRPGPRWFPSQQVMLGR